MSTLWDKRVRHITREVKPTRMRGVRLALIKADVQARLGKPSRNLPAALVTEELRLRIRAESGADTPELREARLRHQAACTRERLLERKRRQRSAAKHRASPGAHETCIYLWRRRQD